MSDSIVSKKATAVVSRTIGKGDEETSTEEISVHEFTTTPASVGVDFGLTINLGNYNSARINVSAQVPCYTEELNEAYDFVQKWVEDRVRAERDQIVSKK